MARKAKEKDGPDALKDWGNITLFYGCRRPDVDYLYSEEWEAFQKELDGKFQIFTAFSRVQGKPKVYVQNLISENRAFVKESLVDKKGYAYICGDAKNMAKDVEELLKEILGEAAGGTKEKEGEAAYKQMKDRNRVSVSYKERRRFRLVVQMTDRCARRFPVSFPLFSSINSSFSTSGRKTLALQQQGPRYLSTSHSGHWGSLRRSATKSALKMQELRLAKLDSILQFLV